jgi:oxygen-independent coproporphyrinogen-3 oxidase
MKKLGLYIHIPFCIKKCDYCDFVSFDSKNNRIESYAGAVICQIKKYAPFLKDYETDSVYLGGGTPTALPVRFLTEILKTVRENVNLTKDCEITCEANPRTGSEELFLQLKAAGVNRISLGLQTAIDSELSALGRIGSKDMVTGTVEGIKKAGIDNFSVDIMYSIPNQTPQTLAQTLEFAISQKPKHISAYALKIGQGTPLFERKEELNLPDEDGDIAMYRQCIDTLKDAGYMQYEISNFAKEGFKSRHNLKYWNCNEYLGIGCGAHSYFGGKRFCFTADLDKYINGVLNDISIVEDAMDIPQSEMVEEYIMLKFRLCEGIDPKDFGRRFGFPFETAFAPQIERFTGSGHMIKENGRYHLTFDGFTISNYIIASFFNE